MNSFKIESVHRTSPELVTVKVTMNSKDWTKLAKSGALGQLYGIDISNLVYREYGVKAYNPIVEDIRKPKRGSQIKLIELNYADTEWQEKTAEIIYVDFVAKKRVA